MSDVMERITAAPLSDRVPPNKRSADVRSDVKLPEGTIVVSADSHLVVADDIYYERAPQKLKERMPRVWNDHGVCQIGIGRKTVVPEFLHPLLAEQDFIPGHSKVAVRVEDMKAEGVAKEVVFPSHILSFVHHPDFEAREATFRIYNEYLAELQEQAPGVFYGVGIAAQWDPANARKSISEMKALGLKTYMVPQQAGKFPDGSDVHYSSDEMTPFWEAVEEAELPICFHIGEGFGPGPRGQYGTKLLQEFGGFRKTVGELIFGGVLDRHPSLRVVFAEGGISWLPVARQDAEMLLSSYRRLMDWKVEKPIEHYFRNNIYASFMTDSLGLSMIDQIGVDRVMWSVDYPHAEGTFGFSRAAMEEIVEATDADGARRILGGNAIEVFGLA